MAHLGSIFIAAIGFGAGGEALRRYRAFKQRRREMPYAERNAGFWTDRRLLWSEMAAAFAISGVPFSAGVVLVGFPRSYIALLAYAGFSLLLVRGMNRAHWPENE